MIHPLHDSVSFLPLDRWREGVRVARTGAWRADVVAGLTVAVFAVPQAMAYAALAGMPPVHGLYAAIVMSVFAALWGSSQFVNAGPSNTAALLTTASLAPIIAAGNIPVAVAVFTLGFMAGILRIAMGVLRLGWLIRFVPVPAFLGFVSAVQLLIAFGQINELMGVPASKATLAPLRTLDSLSRWQQTDFRALIIGAVVCGIMLFSLKWRKVPWALLAMILSGLLVPVIERLLPYPNSVHLVRDIARIPSALPRPEWLGGGLTLWWHLVPAAVTMAALGLIEAVSIGQNLALKYKTEINFNQEFFGLGLAQTIGSIFGGIPGSGSFARTGLNESCGARTFFSNLCFGGFTTIMLLVFPRLLEQIPLAALAGLLFFTGIRMFDPQAIKRVWRTSRSDFTVVAITFLVTFGGKVEWGFFVGIIVAMLLFLAKARELQIFELVPRHDANHENARFDEVRYSADSQHEVSDVVAISLHGDLFFGLAHELRAQLSEILREQKPRFIVLRTRRASSIDYSCWQALFDFAEVFQETGGRLILTGVSDDLRTVIDDAGMKKFLPPENVFAPRTSAWASFKDGLASVAPELDGESRLSSQWQEYFYANHQQAVDAHSLSNWRDPFNDPATLGIAEF